MSTNNYVKSKSFRTKTPQTSPIPGKEHKMVQGRSGGYQFKTDPRKMLRRLLLIGTTGNSYYANQQELTEEMTNFILEFAENEPDVLADEILYASNGKSINNSTPLYALSIMSIVSNKKSKELFKKIFNDVVRTGSHLLEISSYIKNRRSFGPLIKKAYYNWFYSKEPSKLAYQMLKYQNRHGFKMRDVLRLSRPLPKNIEYDVLFEYFVKGWDHLPDYEVEDYLKQIWYREWLKDHNSEDKTIMAIREARLTREMVEGIAPMTPVVWNELFKEMPIGAILRNVSQLSAKGLFNNDLSDNNIDAEFNLERLENILTNVDILKRARIHPIDILKALKIYSSCGKLGKTSNTWIKLPRVVDILEESLNKSFDVIESTNKTFFHAIDVSPSMTVSSIGKELLSCTEIASIFALASIKSEKNYFVGGFNHIFEPLNINKRMSFSSVLNEMQDQNWGTTDASSAYRYALDNNIYVDTFVFWTDGESWSGSEHPDQAFRRYKNAINSNAKAIYITLEYSRGSLCEIEDSTSFDLNGFDPSLPKLIQLISNGEI